MNSNSASESGEWYFDTATHTVVDGPGPDRLGPYPTREKAASAMETVADRNRAWQEDPRWDDKEDEGDTGSKG
ncbi:hypothetical protein [Streptomyces sp. NPDC057939]|uniref:hypothetical protein n=1 Tax=Streptomyces sp. NPDC057939 TaxID=3346284 RepID=UPI0036E34EEE